MLPNRLLLAAAKKRSGPAQDPLTVLLMHMDGKDDGTTFPDSSLTNPKGNATVHGNVVTKTATKKWGTAAYYSPGSAGDYISYANHADYNFVGSTSQDYTIDFQVKFTDHTSNEMFFYQEDTDDGVFNFYLKHSDGVGWIFAYKIGGVQKVTTTEAGEITDTDWHHIALCKVTDGEGGVEWGLYLDATQIAYASEATTHSTSSVLAIGADIAGNTDFSGYIDEFRIIQKNSFGAAPNDTLDDTIVVPTGPYL